MSYTKSQLSVFSSVPSRLKEPSVYKAGDFYYLTDGALLFILDEIPETLSDFPVEDGKFLRDFFGKELSGDHTFLPTQPVPDDLKKAVRDWKEGRKHPTLGTPTHPRVTLQNHVSAAFDARLILDALKAVGPKARCYLGRRNPQSPTTLLVCRDWDTYPQAMILPLRD